MNFIRFELWPWLKVRTTYWWWVVKYGGKKNIPPELIFGKITENMEGMKENIMNAVRAAPADLDEEGKKMIADLLRTVDALDTEFKDIKRGNSDTTSQ